MAFWVTLIASADLKPLPLPADVVAVSKIVKVSERLYLVDHLQDLLWLLAEGQPP